MLSLTSTLIMSVTLFPVNLYIKPLVTRNYIEKFDSVSASTQINLPDVHTMTFGHKLMHWPIVTLTYIEKFDSVVATSQINLTVSCQPYLYFLSFSTLTTYSLSRLTCITRYLNSILILILVAGK